MPQAVERGATSKRGNRRFYIMVAALTAVASVVGHANAWHFVFALLATLLCLLTAILAVVVSRIRPQVRESAINALRHASIVGTCAVVSYALGLPIGSRLIVATELWCERQVPAIERYRIEHGRFPSQLDDMPALEGKPLLVRPDYLRSSDGYGFIVPRGIGGGEWWWSSVRRWQPAYVERLSHARTDPVFVSDQAQGR